MNAEFQIKDSGERLQFDSGMVRDVTKNKIDYSLALDGPMFKRLAAHLTKATATGKYEKRNWMKAAGSAELERFRESAFRHFFQWWKGETDEDHAAAVFFNINGCEYVRERLGESKVGMVVTSRCGLCGSLLDIDGYCLIHGDTTLKAAPAPASPTPAEDFRPF